MIHVRLLALAPAIDLLVGCSGGPDYIRGTLTLAESTHDIDFHGNIHPGEAGGVTVGGTYDPVRIWASTGRVSGTTNDTLTIDPMPQVAWQATPWTTTLLTFDVDGTLGAPDVVVRTDPPQFLDGEDCSWRVSGSMSNAEGLGTYEGEFAWTVCRSAVNLWSVAGNGDPPPEGTELGGATPLTDGLLVSNCPTTLADPFVTGPIVGGPDRTFTTGDTSWRCDPAAGTSWCSFEQEGVVDGDLTWHLVGAATADLRSLHVGGWASDGSTCDAWYVTDAWSG